MLPKYWEHTRVDYSNGLPILLVDKLNKKETKLNEND